MCAIMDNDRSAQAKHLACWLTLMLLFAWQMAHPAMMLKTSSRIKGKTLNLFIMPMVVNKTPLDVQIELASARDNSSHYLKVTDFLGALGLPYEEDEQLFRVFTTIGQTNLRKEDCRIVNDYWVMDMQLLSEQLAMDIDIDQETFAIYVDSLWYQQLQAVSGELVRPGGPAQTADFAARDNSLAYVRNEYFFRHQNDQTSQFSETELGGRLLGGSWQVTARDYLEDDPYIEDYLWFKTNLRSRYMVGNHTLALNPLLESTDFTGVQMAWSNQGIQPFLRNIQSRQLINDAYGSVRSFNGEGFPGGRVELRVDGVVLAETIARLDGSFEFRDVEVPGGQYVSIEAWAFRPNERGVPGQVTDLSRYNNNRNLASNTWLLQSGIGLNGNLIEDPSSQLDEVAYLRSQYTFNDHLTVNSLFQRIDQRDMFLLGTRGYWGMAGYWELDSAHMDGQTAWRIENNNQTGDWLFRAGAQHRPAGWINANQQAFDDRFAELMFNRFEQFNVSLIHRRTTNNMDDINYTLPAFRWRPHARFTLQARPDYNGDYMYRAHWKVNRRHQLNMYSDADEDAANWTIKLAPRRAVNVQYLNREAGTHKTSLIYNQYSRGLRTLGWSAGVIAGENDWGYLAQMDYEFIPGLRVRGQVIRDPLNTAEGETTDTVIGLNIIASFNLSGGGITRGYYLQPLNNTGVISGRIRIPEAFQEQTVEPLWVLIDGQRRTQTEADGQFSISSLDPGIYEVKLDVAGLPFELAPVKDTYWVEVKANANSFFEYQVQLQLGVSGQLFQPNGMAYQNHPLDIYTEDGQFHSRSQTNLFGQFRVEQLPPGSHWIKADNQHCARVILTDQYITLQKFRTQPSATCEALHHE
jgi:hypothetical protein